jgi:hypothetical protein
VGILDGADLVVRVLVPGGRLRFRSGIVRVLERGTRLVKQACPVRPPRSITWMATSHTTFARWASRFTRSNSIPAYVAHPASSSACGRSRIRVRRGVSRCSASLRADAKRRPSPSWTRPRGGDRVALGGLCPTSTGAGGFGNPPRVPMMMAGRPRRTGTCFARRSRAPLSRMYLKASLATAAPPPVPSRETSFCPQNRDRWSRD